MSGRQSESPTIFGICRHLCEYHKGQVGTALVEMVVNEATTTWGTEVEVVVFQPRTKGICLSSANSGVISTGPRCTHSCTLIEINYGLFNLREQSGVVFFQPKPAIEP